jgi:hypothetical protein
MDIFFDVTKIIESIGIIISAIVGIKVFLKNPSFSKRKILKGKYLHYKKIRKKYSKDKNCGYFLLQQYFKRCLPLDEMDHILDSSDAYKAFVFLNAGREKCEFKDNEYTLKDKDINKEFKLWFIGYFLSLSIITFYIVYADCILKKWGTYNFFVISAYIMCLGIPLFITCVMSMNEIACAKRLAGITNKEEGQRKKCILFGNKRLR